MSAESIAQADSGYNGLPRRVPQFLALGAFNQWGDNLGPESQFALNSDGLWELKIMAAWPSFVQLNVWGINVLDYYYGDTDGDGVLDRLPPNTESPNYCNMSAPVRTPRFLIDKLN